MDPVMNRGGMVMVSVQIVEDKVLTMVNEICLAVLKPCVKNTLKSHVEHSFMQTMDGKKVKTRLLGPVGEGTKFGPPYFDGHVVVERWGLSSP
eukprot:990150-Amphidinium_carterae.1